MTHPTALEPAIRDALDGLTLQTGAMEEEISVMATAAPRRLPDDYVAFLRASNGAAGRIGDNFIQIFSADGAADTTRAFADFVPGLFFFAGDGAEGLFAFDLRDERSKVVITHADDLDFEGLVTVAESFTAFVRFLHKNDWIGFWSAERSRST